MKKIILIGAGIVICFFYARQQFFRPQVIHVGVSYIIYPVLLLHACISEYVNAYMETKKSAHEAAVSVQRYKQENERLNGELVKMTGLLAHVRGTQELAAFKKRYDMSDAIIVRILVRHFSEQAHYVLVEGGADRDIKPDMIAVYHNMIVGKVVEVYPWYSKIMLITDARCKIASFCATTGAQGIYQGMNSERSATVLYVNHLQSVKEHDIILSSGQGLIFPHGFGLGKVVQCAKQELHYAITLEPLIDFSRIDYCLIMARHAGTDEALL